MIEYAMCFFKKKKNLSQIHLPMENVMKTKMGVLDWRFGCKENLIRTLIGWSNKWSLPIIKWHILVVIMQCCQRSLSLHQHRNPLVRRCNSARLHALRHKQTRVICHVAIINLWYRLCILPLNSLCTVYVELFAWCYRFSLVFWQSLFVIHASWKFVK